MNNVDKDRITDDLLRARAELESAKDKYREVIADVLVAMRDMSVREAADCGLIRFGFSTEGISQRQVQNMLSPTNPTKRSKGGSYG